jgi:hypothetical protein
LSNGTGKMPPTVSPVAYLTTIGDALQRLGQANERLEKIANSALHIENQLQFMITGQSVPSDDNGKVMANSGFGNNLEHLNWLLDYLEGRIEGILIRL